MEVINRCHNDAYLVGSKFIEDDILECKQILSITSSSKKLDIKCNSSNYRALGIFN